jgi:hypothetical protein
VRSAVNRESLLSVKVPLCNMVLSAGGTKVT